MPRPTLSTPSPTRSTTLTRRGLLGGAVALALVACGSNSTPASTTTTGTGTFPATVTHKFGTATVPS
jgi:ABC-type Fe3+-hydroxamate transport system substrate-binding protein